MKVVVALGGNALETKEAVTPEAQREIIEQTAGHLAGFVEGGHQLVITHGNGPQIGKLLVAFELAKAEVAPYPFDVCGAMTQGMIGYAIQQALVEKLRVIGQEKPVATVITQICVDENDPRFQNPTKPIGPFYTETEAQQLAAARGYIVKEDANRGWRRVVASPLPKQIIELDTIETLIDAGHIVISCGGGGIPVIETEGGVLQGVAAVIDKDFASARLAEDLDADRLVILTAVDYAALYFGTPEQKNLTSLSIAEAEQYAAEGQFSAGSMLPKIQAAIQFASSKPGRKAIITSLEKGAQALSGRYGTVIGT